MISSITYNGYTFQYDATIQGITGLGLPAIRSESQAKPNQDGAVPLNFNYGARIFGWKGHINNTTPALYLAERQALAYALNPSNIAGDEMTFNLITGDTRTLRNVVVTEGPLDMPEDEPSRTWNSYAVLFRADFPFFEGESTSNTQAITEITGGVVVPAPVPAPLISSSGVGSNKASLTNAGNAPAYPIITVTGPGTTFTITNETTGQILVISTTLVAGESIVIDTWEKTAYKGSNNVRSSIPSDSDWIYLEGGAAGGVNIISFTADSGSTSETTLTIDYKDTYLNI